MTFSERIGLQLHRKWFLAFHLDSQGKDNLSCIISYKMTISNILTLFRIQRKIWHLRKGLNNQCIWPNKYGNIRIETPFFHRWGIILINFLLFPTKMFVELFKKFTGKTFHSFPILRLPSHFFQAWSLGEQSVKTFAIQKMY